MDQRRLWIIDPEGRNQEEARRMAHAVVDLLVDHFASLAKRPLVEERNLPGPPPAGGRPWAQVLDLLKDDVLPGSMQPAHPGFIGHMDSGPLFLAVLGDLVAASLNQNLLHREMSPLASAMDEQLIGWLAAKAGLPTASEGTFVSGGTAANLTALALARTAHPERRMVIASQEAHYSIRKSLQVMGFAPEDLVALPVDGDFRMNPQALRAALRENPSALAVVATAGTTSTGSVDPLAPIGDLCREHGVWLHVDAAHGGAALFSPAARGRLRGIDQADSLVIDPHKWMLQPKSIGAVICRHAGLFGRTFGSDAPYLRQAGRPSLGQWTLQGTRRWDSLRLWLSWQYLGDEGFGEIVDRTLERTAYLRAAVDADPGLEAAHAPDLNILCFRPPVSDQEIEGVRANLVRSGAGFLSQTSLRGRRWLRAVLLNPSTTDGDLDRILGEIRRDVAR
ncbi:MAG: aminotransferase class V-fold PLP-dependent enzyme [Thermaerobacter sp.]|nr:aminotransferase class V-fold PLP-dependent enzyme [Thermaerobacter sp.]